MWEQWFRQKSLARGKYPMTETACRRLLEGETQLPTQSINCNHEEERESVRLYHIKLNIFNTRFSVNFFFSICEIRRRSSSYNCVDLHICILLFFLRDIQKMFYPFQSSCSRHPSPRISLPNLDTPSHVSHKEC